MPLFHDLLDMIYPRYCLGCDALLEQEEVLCAGCMNELPFTHFFETAANPVKEIFYGRIVAENAGSLLFYTKDSLTQRLLFDLKYRRNEMAGKFLGRLLAAALQQTNFINGIDVIVAMPMHPKKERERGYNQATIIAKELSQHLSVPFDDKAVVKSIHTETQTHKTREDRWHSMQHIFKIKEEGVLRGKHILLVDDVLTTGATLEVCGNEILKVPDAKLSIATAAYAL